MLPKYRAHAATENCAKTMPLSLRGTNGPISALFVTCFLVISFALVIGLGKKRPGIELLMMICLFLGVAIMGVLFVNSLFTVRFHIINWMFADRFNVSGFFTWKNSSN